MNLHPDDGRLFYKLYSALLFFANERLHVLDKPVADARAKGRQCSIDPCLKP